MHINKTKHTHTQTSQASKALNTQLECLQIKISLFCEFTELCTFTYIHEDEVCLKRHL